MVAYSFKAMFADPIERGVKCQTVRAGRARHARVGEAVQLYTAMRTRHCRKLITPDPICIEVQSIEIDIGPKNPNIITDIEIDGVALTADEIETFAIADGFGGDLLGATARRNMGLFWLKNHQSNAFKGVVIRWKLAE